MDHDFEDNVSARHDGLVRFAHLTAGASRSDAEDLVQEALARVYERSRRSEILNIDAVVHRAIVNLAISWYRSDSVMRRILPRLISSTQNTVEEFDHRGALWRSVAELPVKQRAVLVMHYYHDLSYSEIAATMQISENTVRSQCMRAERALAGALESEMDVTAW